MDAALLSFDHSGGLGAQLPQSSFSLYTDNKRLSPYGNNVANLFNGHSKDEENMYISQDHTSGSATQMMLGPERMTGDNEARWSFAISGQERGRNVVLRHDYDYDTRQEAENQHLERTRQELLRQQQSLNQRLEEVTKNLQSRAAHRANAATLPRNDYAGPEAMSSQLVSQEELVRN